MIKLLAFLFQGIPLIAASLFAQFSRKYSVAVTALIVFASLTAIFVACINALLQVCIGLIVLPGWLGNAIGMFVPGNFAAVLGAMVSANICRNAYRFSVDKVKLITYAN